MLPVCTNPSYQLARRSPHPARSAAASTSGTACTSPRTTNSSTVCAPRRIEVFHRAAAARPGISKRLNLVSASKKTIYKPGEVWWTDSSPNYPLNIDGNRRISHFFEEFTSVPVLSFFPDKSASSFVRSIKHLEKRLLILCPGVKLKLIRGDFDTAWSTQGRPGDITTREVQDFVATRDGLQIIPIVPHSQSLNKAEPNIRRLATFALANAVRSNLNWDLCWEDMFRGAEIQYQLHHSVHRSHWPPF